MWSDLVQFVVSALVIIFAGTRLTKYADILSDRFNLSKAWIGVVLLGFVTSLPEVATSLTAIVSVGAPDLAVGNVLGSNNFNLIIVVILDILYREGPVTNKVKTTASHILSAVFAITLSAIVLAEILLSRRMQVPTVGGVSIGTIFIALIYFLGIRLLFQRQDDNVLYAPKSETESGKTDVKKIFLNIFVSIVLIFIGARWLTHSADAIAEYTGLGQMFVGSVFLAFVTSLPEIVVSVSALRLGSLDLAFGNIFGSNMINMFIVFLCDICYRQGAVLADVSLTHIFVVLLSIILTSVVIIGIKTDKRPVFAGLGWDTLLMGTLFIIGMNILYLIR